MHCTNETIHLAAGKYVAGNKSSVMKENNCQTKKYYCYTDCTIIGEGAIISGSFINLGNLRLRGNIRFEGGTQGDYIYASPVLDVNGDITFANYDTEASPTFFFDGGRLNVSGGKLHADGNFDLSGGEVYFYQVALPALENGLYMSGVTGQFKSCSTYQVTNSPIQISDSLTPCSILTMGSIRFRIRH